MKVSTLAITKTTLSVTFIYRLGMIMSNNLDGRHTQKITDSCRPSTVQDAYENIKMQEASNLRSLLKHGPTNLESEVWNVVLNEFTCSLIQVLWSCLIVNYICHT